MPYLAHGAGLLWCVYKGTSGFLVLQPWPGQSDTSAAADAALSLGTACPEHFRLAGGAQGCSTARAQPLPDGLGRISASTQSSALMAGSLAWNTLLRDPSAGCEPCLPSGPRPVTSRMESRLEKEPDRLLAHSSGDASGASRGSCARPGRWEGRGARGGERTGRAAEGGAELGGTTGREGRRSGREGGQEEERGCPGRLPRPAPHLSEQRRLRPRPRPLRARPWLGRCRCCSAWPRWAPAAGQGPPPPARPGPPQSRCRTRRTTRRTSSRRYRGVLGVLDSAGCCRAHTGSAGGYRAHAE